MKTPHSLDLRLVILFAAFSVVLPFSSPASAQIIGINFQGDDTDPLLSSDSTGVVSADNWNNLLPASGTVSAPNLVDSNDAGTSLALTYTSAYNVGGTPGTSTPFNNLYGSHLESPYVVADSDTFAQAISSGNRVTLSLTSIPYASYDLYVYTANQPADIYQATSSSTVINTANMLSYTAAGSPTFVNGNNYVEFTNLTGASQYLYVGFPSADDAAGLNSGIAGIQIVDTDTTAAPEPSTYALTLAGIGLLVVFSRRRQIRQS